MQVPILKQGRFLIATVQDALSDAELLKMSSELLAQIGKYRTRGVVIDVSLLDVIDSFSARTLRGVAESVRLLGAAAVVVGIQPEVAMAMVRLGLTLETVDTALDLDEGLADLQRQLDARRDHGG